VRYPSDHVPQRYRTTYRPGHPVASARGHAQLHRVVLYDAIGPGQHPCHWCGTPVEWAFGQRGTPAGALVSDHVDGDRLNNALVNLVPSCGVCNGHRLPSWEPWQPGDPVGVRDLRLEMCRSGRHELTEGNVYVHPSKSAARECLACRRVRSRAA
jgi:hypothetical protein